MKPHPKTGRTIREEAELIADGIGLYAPGDRNQPVADTIERAILRYAAPRYTKNGNGRPKDAPDPRVKDFLVWFCDAYNSYSHGAEYTVSWARDGATVKKLLKTLSVEALKDCAVILLDVRTDDKFIQESDRGIGMLSTKINWLNGRRAGFLARKREPRL